MKKYIEIELKASFNMPYHVLLSKVVQQLHFVFVNNTKLGLSYPQYSKKRHTLGNIIRVFGSVEELEIIKNSDNLKGFVDNITISDILDVPETCKYGKYSRFRSNFGHTYAGLARVARRKSRRSGMTYEEAFEYISSFNIDEEDELPFVSIKSVSTGGIFRLHINFVEWSTENVVEEYNSYGLSSVNTVPVF